MLHAGPQTLFNEVCGMKRNLRQLPIANAHISLCNSMFLSNEFHFSDVYRSINYIGLRAKWMNPKQVHVDFASLANQCLHFDKLHWVACKVNEPWRGSCKLS